MNKKTLLAFMQRILQNGSDIKSRYSLGQLLAILQTQNADPEMIDMVQKVIAGVPEAKEAARSAPVLTEEALRIADKRAEERRKREEEARLRGRC